MTTPCISPGAFRSINRHARYRVDEAAFPGIRQRVLQRVANALRPIEARPSQTHCLVGDRPTLAAIYLGVFAGWSARVGRLADFSALRNFLARYRARESLARILVAEGLALVPPRTAV